MFRGYYVNLDRSPERKSHIEREIAKINRADRYQRFAAIDGSALPTPRRVSSGALGCFLSHLELIEKHGADTFIHILEDDSVLSPKLASLADDMISGGALSEYDLIFFGVLVMPSDFNTLRRLKHAFDDYRKTGTIRLIDLKGFLFAGTGSYLVNPARRGRLLTSMRREVLNGPHLPLDVWYRREIAAGRITATCFFPFLSTIEGSFSSTINLTPKPIYSIITELTSAFYVDADVAAGLRKVAAIVGPRPPDPHLDLLASIQRFLITDKGGEF